MNIFMVKACIEGPKGRSFSFTLVFRQTFNRATMPHLFRLLVPCLLIAFATSVDAQNIGINVNGASPAASSLLDIDASALPANGKRGLLIPRIALTSRIVAAPVVAPAASLVVYNTATAGAAPNNVTPGYYYWDGTSQWLRMFSGNDAWSTTGNNGTTAGTNFIGTIDVKDFVVKTGGSAAVNERMRVLSGGQVVVNNTSRGPFTNDVFSVYGTGATNGTTTAISSLGVSVINAYASGDGTGIYGETNSSTTSLGIGVFGVLNALNLPASNPPKVNQAVLGINTSSPLGTLTTAGDARGVEGDATGTPGNGSTIGVAGFALATTGDARGVIGQSSSSLGIGVFGAAASTAAGGQPVGIYGVASNATGFGALVVNTDNSGTGEFAVGQNAGGTYLAGGSGGSYSGKGVGGFGYAETGVSGCGLVGAGNNGVIYTPARGCGVSGTGKQYGVVGFATTVVNTNPNNNSAANLANASAGGYFEVQNAGTAQTWAYVGVRETAGAMGLRKIIGPGTVNTIVTGLNGERVALSCPEAPENLFQDYGAGKLVQGRAHIDIDPVFAKNIVVDRKHPLRVFIQLEGDCNGVYVIDKTGQGFDVVELGGGRSSVPFTYTVIANRADETLPDGSVSRYSEERFPPAPGPIGSVEQKIVRVERRNFTELQPSSKDRVPRSTVSR